MIKLSAEDKKKVSDFGDNIYIYISNLERLLIDYRNELGFEDIKFLISLKEKLENLYLSQSGYSWSMFEFSRVTALIYSLIGVDDEDQMKQAIDLKNKNEENFKDKAIKYLIENNK